MWQGAAEPLGPADAQCSPNPADLGCPNPVLRKDWYIAVLGSLGKGMGQQGLLVGFTDILNNCNLNETSEQLVMGCLKSMEGSRIVVCWPLLIH